MDKDSPPATRLIPEILKKPVEYVRNISDDGIRYMLYAYAVPHDTLLQHMPTIWETWDCLESWERTKETINSVLLRTYRKNVLPLFAIMKSFKEKVDKTKLLKTVGVETRLNVNHWQEQYGYAGKINVSNGKYDQLQPDQASLVQALAVGNIVGGMRGIKSAFDGNGIFWRNGSSRVEDGLFTYNGYSVKMVSNLDPIFSRLGKQVRLEIQGKLDRTELVKSMIVSPRLTIVGNKMKQWIISEETRDDEIEKLLMAMAGSTQLMESQHLRLAASNDGVAYFHTCSFTANIPIEWNDEDFDIVPYLLSMLN